ncbi:hypothetical protein NpNSSI1_00004301 [Neofusicoccum parvum]|nr:hypothetical protein NpNSSI1_00004301 [Neofusicoccum parvum]
MPTDANHATTTDPTATQNTPAADGTAAQADELRRQKTRDRKRAWRARIRKAIVDQNKERPEDLVVIIDRPVPRNNFRSTDGQHVVRLIPTNKVLHKDYQRAAGYLGLANTTEIKKVYDDS